VSKTDWEVWSNGRAFGQDPDHAVLYRWSDGSWRTALTSLGGVTAKASTKIEETFSAYLASVIAGVEELRRSRRG
jgi:hypothetical protein